MPLNFKVMTFNMHHGKGTDGILNLERIARIIADSGADLVSLNEVDRFFARRSGHTDQIRWLAERLGMHPTFGPALTARARDGREAGQYGNAMLSRYPIAAATNHRLDFFAGLIEGRSLLETQVLLEGQPLKMYVTHLSLNPILHRKQMSFLLNKILAENSPVIVAGDFNMKPGSKGWRSLTAHLTDVCQATGGKACYTYPSARPQSQLDYIFAGGKLSAVSVEVVRQAPSASDHLPLLAAFTLPESGPKHSDS